MDVIMLVSAATKLVFDGIAAYLAMAFLRWLDRRAG